MASLVQTSCGVKLAVKRVADDVPQPHNHVKKPRKIISVAGLFAKKPLPERAKDTPSSGITRKQLTAEELLDARAKRHPAYLGVEQATAAYRHSEAGSVAEQLDAIHDELLARIDGLDINGKPLDLPGVPSKDKLEEMQNGNAVFRPLEDDVVTISVFEPDGGSALKHIKLGDSIQKLENLIAKSKNKLTRLNEELHVVNEEIAAALDKYDKATESVNDAFQNKIAKYQAEVRSFHEWTISEMIKARKEDKASGVEANRKLQEFAASLI